MATYYSDLWRLGRAAVESGASRLCATVVIPDGTAIAEADVIKICNLPAGTLVTQVVREIPVDLSGTIADSPLLLGSVEVSDDIVLGTPSCAAVGLAATNAVSATDDDLKIVVGAVTDGVTTAGRKIYFVVDLARFKDNTVVYDWGGIASERINGTRTSDTAAA